MPHVTTDDGVKLYYEEIGSGIPIVFVHEFAGDFRSYEPQVRYLSRRYRCIAYNARGYPPSDVPEDGERYSQDRARDDIRDVLDGLEARQGAYRRPVDGRLRDAAFRLHLSEPRPVAGRRRLRLRRAAGQASSSSSPRPRRAAKNSRRSSMAKAADGYALGPTRVQFQNKDPRGWAEFRDQLAEHSTEGSADTMRGVQARRPSLYELTDRMKTITAPTLIMTGDEDWQCLEPGLLMKRMIPTVGAGGDAECRPRHQHRGAGRLQPASRRFLPCGRRRRLAQARPAGAGLGDIRTLTKWCAVG